MDAPVLEPPAAAKSAPHVFGLSCMPADLPELERIFNRICAAHPTVVGKKASAKDREGMVGPQSCLTYGEIMFHPFAVAMLKVRDKYSGFPVDGGRFYDLGAGTGKPVFAAALLHPWEVCRGIEVLPGLHSVSLELLAAWKRPDSQALLPPWAKANVDLMLADATAFPWDDADVWFANSTCFDETLLLKLAVIADRMRVGTHAITFTKRLPSDKWTVLESETQVMSWGYATVHIQRKTA